MLEFLILFILKITPSNIYEIKKSIDKGFAPIAQVSSGAILPALNRLEKLQAIKCEKQISQGGLRKSVYTLLQAGEEKFESYLKSPIDGAPQLARREIETLLVLLGHEAFSTEQTTLLKEKIINGLQDNISLLKKTIALQTMNTEYFQLELEHCEKILAKFFS